MIVENNIENEKRILIQGKGNYSSKLKKGKLKTKKLLKIARYIRWKRALSTISRASLKLRKYAFTKTWKVVVTVSISENKYWVPCQKESQATISESSHVYWSFIQQRAHLCLRPCSLESFNISAKTKPVCFRGHSYIDSSHSLDQIDASGWVGLALWW